MDALVYLSGDTWLTHNKFLDLIEAIYNANISEALRTDPMTTLWSKLRLFAVGCLRLTGRKLTDMEKRVLSDADGKPLLPESLQYYTDRDWRARMLAPWHFMLPLDDTFSYQGVWDTFHTQLILKESIPPIAQSEMLRCVFHNPFVPIPKPFPYVWMSWEGGLVPNLAQKAYDARAHNLLLDRDRLLILADALEECGCNYQPALDHLRSRWNHARGCWVLDWILGKRL